MTMRALPFACLALLLLSSSVSAYATAPARCEPAPGLEDELIRRIAERIGTCPLVTLGAADARALAEARPGHSIVNLKIDMRVGTFSAALAETRDAGSLRIVRQLRGSLSMSRDVPVVTRRVLPGEVIDAGDVRIVSVDARHVPPNAVLEMHQLVGFEPRWPITPLVPVSRAQVKSALAVERGAGVRAVFRRAGIELTTNLVAVDGGAVGQTITLRNPSSNKLVRGRISDAGAVELE